MEQGREHLGAYYTEAQLRNTILRPLINAYQYGRESDLDDVIAMGVELAEISIRNSNVADLYLDYGRVIRTLNSSLDTRVDYLVGRSLRNPDAVTSSAPSSNAVPLLEALQQE